MSSPASFPRIIDHWLGGPQHTPADSEAGDLVEAESASVPGAYRAQRVFQTQALASLFEKGITQFLVFEAGLPTAGQAHLQLPDAKIYYTDSDFDVVQPGAGLLAGVRRRVRYQTLDATDLENLEDLEFSPVLNTEAPIGIVLVGATEGMSDDDLQTIAANLHKWAPAGSALVLSAMGPEGQALSEFRGTYGKATTLRDLATVQAAFSDWEFTTPALGTLPDAPAGLVGGVAHK